MTRLTEKGRGIRDMFDRIAPRYDLLNRLLSLGIDQRWRRFAVRQLAVPENGRVLDIATGTGDVALEIGRQTSSECQDCRFRFYPGDARAWPQRKLPNPPIETGSCWSMLPVNRCRIRMAFSMASRSLSASAMWLTARRDWMKWPVF